MMTKPHWWICKLVEGRKPILRPLPSDKAARRAFSRAAREDWQERTKLVRVHCAVTGDIAAQFEERGGCLHYAYPTEGLSIYAPV